MAAVDAAGNNSYSIVTITAINKTHTAVNNTHTKLTHINWWLSERENTQVIRETDNCTLINVTLHTNDSNTLDKPDGALLFTVAELRDSTLLNNTGINGAAIMLIGDSLIYLTQELRANFTHNKALFSGGAIYAVERQYVPLE